VGGPGNSLDINYHYSLENDINFIAEKSNNTNVRSEILFWRHDKSWINRKVSSVNLRLDRALMGCGKIPSSCYGHHVIPRRRIHNPCPASKFMRCLRYINCNCLEFRNQNITVDSSN
jgi:hypothetical protein